MQNQQHNVAEMTYSDGLALVAATRRAVLQKRAAMRAVRGPLEKQATMEEIRKWVGGLWDKAKGQVSEKGKPLKAMLPKWLMSGDKINPQLLYPALGALGGGALGGLSSLRQEKGHRQPYSRALTGALLGGLGTFGAQQLWPLVSGDKAKAPALLNAEDIMNREPTLWETLVGPGGRPEVKAERELANNDPAHPVNQYLRPEPHGALHTAGHVARPAAAFAAGAIPTRMALQPFHRNLQLQQFYKMTPKDLPAGINAKAISGPTLPEYNTRIATTAANQFPRLNRIPGVGKWVARTLVTPGIDKAIMEPAMTLGSTTGRDILGHPTTIPAGKPTGYSNTASVAKLQPGMPARYRVGVPLGVGSLLAAGTLAHDYYKTPELWNAKRTFEASNIRSAIQGYREASINLAAKLPPELNVDALRARGDKPRDIIRKWTLALGFAPELKNNPEYVKFLELKGY
jgi:hypothetical protein